MTNYVEGKILGVHTAPTLMLEASSTVSASQPKDVYLLASAAKTTIKPSASKAMEAAVEEVVRQVQANSSPGSKIRFQGKEYKVGNNRVNVIFNDALEKSGSKRRVVFYNAPNGAVAVLYGTVIQERKIRVHGQQVRHILLDKAEISVNETIGILGVNDLLDVIVVSKDHCEKVDAFDRKKNSGTYKQAEHTSILDAYRAAPLDTEGLKLFADLVFAHETGHFEFIKTYGAIVKEFEMRDQAAGRYHLHTLEELLCEVATAQSIVALAKKDPRAAEKAYQIWVGVRGDAPGRRTYNPAEGWMAASGFLLLSAVSMKSGTAVVDWGVLEKNTGALKSVIKTVFTDVQTRIIKPLVKDGSQDTPQQLAAKYKELEKVTLAQWKTANAPFNAEFAEQEVAMGIMEQLFPQREKMGLGPDSIIRMVYTVDAWTVTQLGVNPAATPFRIRLR
ncbi:MAG: hypothetical protein Q7T03_07915 [Deltaproteobacteria bacterium]|nr:hypothetical protein [Deltaproteobacteria bacterium]